jgi:hypothetical protein
MPRSGAAASQIEPPQDEEKRRNSMKKQALAIGLGLVFVGLAVSQTYAQKPTLVADIPFAFQAGDQMMPAGQYSVQRLFTAGEDLRLLRRAGGSANLIVPTMPMDNQARGGEVKLVFHKYGDTCFLSQIWEGGQSRKLYESKREKELARVSRGTELAVLAHFDSAQQ